jgi:hypothetical protein
MNVQRKHQLLASLGSFLLVALLVSLVRPGLQFAQAESFAGPGKDNDHLAADTWLIMLYSNADDETLEEDIFIDLNEAELVGSTDQVQIVSQLDRFEGGFDGDGDWTTTRRYYITQDDDLEHLNSEELEDLGEANMADGDTLVDFVTWAAETYPADHYVLILSDHGMGWPGGWNDPDPDPPGEHHTDFEQHGDMLFLMEMDKAFATIQEQTDIDMFELVGFDACVMGHIEVFAMLEPYANYTVASQELEPGVGWAYASFLGQLVEDPSMDGAALGKAIVDSYIVEDSRITTDEDRTETFADITLTAFNLSAMPTVKTALDALVTAMNNADQQDIAAARTYAQAFDNVLDEESPSPYVDLLHFAQLAAGESQDADVRAAARQLGTALKQAIVAEKHGPQRPGATGVSIYFPVSNTYELYWKSYLEIANRFTEGFLWDEFLDAHYTGQPMDEEPPPDTRRVVAPGASALSMDTLSLSEETIAQDEMLIISTNVSGEQVGYIYSYTGYYDAESNAMLVADMDFIASEETTEVGGVAYPNWGEERPIALEFEWEPVLYEITNGTDTAFALLEPATYAESDAGTTYFVGGIYTFADTNNQRYAELIFNATGALVKVMGYTNMDGTGAPREITPQNGDTFTVLEQWIQLNDAGEEVETVTEEGDTLTFGATPFTWEAVIAPAGSYEVGIIAEDLDGNQYAEYAEVNVTEAAQPTPEPGTNNKVYLPLVRR